MSQIRKIAMFGGTFAVALGIGFVMQNGDVLAARFGAEDDLRAAQEQVQNQAELNAFIVLDAMPEDDADTGQATLQQAAVQEAELGPYDAPVLPDLPQPQLSSLVGLLPMLSDAGPALPSVPVRLAAVDPDSIPLVGADGVLTIETIDCAPMMSTVAAPGASVEITLDAPCAPDAQVTLHHQGVMFTFFTDTAGQSAFTVPALAETAVFIADINGSEGAMGMVEVPDYGMYDRAVLQWQGHGGLELHARQFGADYGQEGHIWHQATPTMDLAVTDGTGYLMRYGDVGRDSALVAEIYTFPSGYADRGGDIRLSAEIEITEQNCGREISAQSLQMGPGIENSATDLTLTIPDCDAVGDFLVLQNMFEDLTLASK